MSTSAPISVVVASHGRPDHLLRCLTALRYQCHPRFEVVVVADRSGLDALSGHPAAHRVKRLHLDEAHLSRARNLGIGAAAGEVLAFIDDDAVPEPTWLEHLCQGLADTGAAAVVGSVRGRNGVSFQSRMPSIDRWGFTQEIPESQAASRALPDGWVPKLVGTNMAVRREVLLALGGFDEAFRFYLEDADLSLRLAGAGHAVSFAPDAQVHHSYAASARRGAERQPLTLFDIGRSVALFLRKHAEDAGAATALAAVRADQRRRLLRHMVIGTCAPGDIGRLLKDFDDGVALAGATQPNQFPALAIPETFAPFSQKLPVEAHLLAGRPWQARDLRARAAALAKDGHIATLMLFSPTTLYHHRAFATDGYWMQTGGTLGRAVRSENIIQMQSLRGRVLREWQAIESVRKPAATIFRTHIAGRTRP